MISTKIEKALDNLTSNYYPLPFTLLSPEHITEVVNAVRYIEMRESEIYQISGGKGYDYLFVIEGSLNIITRGEVRCIEDPEETRKAPIVMESKPATSTIVTRSNCIVCHADRDMKEDCTLSVLDKKDFDELISNPLIKKVNQKVAKTMFETDYIPIDVRYAEEYDDSHIPSAMLIPLFELRNRMDELDRNKKYISYCHGGSRSAVDTLVLTQNQFDVMSLDGGLRDWEFETESV